MISTRIKAKSGSREWKRFLQIAAKIDLQAGPDREIRLFLHTVDEPLEK